MIVPAETKVKATAQGFRGAARHAQCVGRHDERRRPENPPRHPYCIASNLTFRASGLTRVQKSIGPRSLFKWPPRRLAVTFRLYKIKIGAASARRFMEADSAT
jgi:hypothetical protein